jgi:hypothetical protein
MDGSLVRILDCIALHPDARLAHVPPGTVVRSMLGEPTGTSGKFVSMMERALDEFQEKHGVQLEKVTLCPLEGEGTIAVRVDK